MINDLASADKVIIPVQSQFFFYNKSAISYEDDNCEIDIYAVRLYIPVKTCEDNKMMYLKANEEVINSISYLKKLEYASFK